jgi:hypothetical protein
MESLKQYPAGVSETRSPRDLMYNSDPASYGGLGRAGLDAIRLAMRAAQKETVSSILDLPSGHGRVLRVLKAEFPAARFAACDIDHEAVDFCAETFDATPVYGREHPGDVDLDERFDLIWCGSLFTHLDESGWEEFLDFFESKLTRGGLLVFTSHGRDIVKRLRDPVVGAYYIPTDSSRKAILDGYGESGFGFASFELDDDARESLSQPKRYGISLTEPSWVMSLVQRHPSLRLVSYMEGRWGAQDVVGCVHVPPDAIDADLRQTRKHLEKRMAEPNGV